MLPADGENFESRTEKVADSKISGYVWTGPSDIDKYETDFHSRFHFYNFGMIGRI